MFRANHYMFPKEVHTAFSSIWLELEFMVCCSPIREQPHFYQLRHKHGKNEAYLHECGKKGA